MKVGDKARYKLNPYRHIPVDFSSQCTIEKIDIHNNIFLEWDRQGSGHLSACTFEYFNKYLEVINESKVIKII